MKIIVSLLIFVCTVFGNLHDVSASEFMVIRTGYDYPRDQLEKLPRLNWIGLPKKYSKDKPIHNVELIIEPSETDPTVARLSSNPSRPLLIRHVSIEPEKLLFTELGEEDQTLQLGRYNDLSSYFHSKNRELLYFKTYGHIENDGHWPPQLTDYFLKVSKAEDTNYNAKFTSVKITGEAKAMRPFRILWAGDLNQDDFPDFYIDMQMNTGCEKETLFLSKKIEDGGYKYETAEKIGFFGCDKNELPQ